MSEETVALVRSAVRDVFATTYDMVFLADSEWDNEVMAAVARDWFAERPQCEFVLVYEHGGWSLGYRRDLTIWSTANDCAVLGPGARPSGFSGRSYRRTAHDADRLAIAMRCANHEPGVNMMGERDGELVHEPAA